MFLEDSVWLEVVPGVVLMGTLAVSCAVPLLRPLAAALVAFSVYNALEVWTFDRVPQPSVSASASPSKLFITSPQLNKEPIQQMLSSRPENWEHTAARALLLNPDRRKLRVFAAFNPVVALGLWCGVYSSLAAITSAVLLAALVHTLLDTLDAHHRVVMDAAQKQAEHVVWSTKPRSPARIVSRVSSTSSTASRDRSERSAERRTDRLDRHSGSSSSSTGRGPIAMPSLTGLGLPAPITGLATPDGSAPSSPVVGLKSQKSFSSVKSANISTTSLNGPVAGVPLAGTGCDLVVPRARHSTLVPPPLNPRRTSSYRMSTPPLQVPEMAPRRVASMASRDNMRRHYMHGH